MNGMYHWTRFFDKIYISSVVVSDYTAHVAFIRPTELITDSICLIVNANTNNVMKTLYHCIHILYFVVLMYRFHSETAALLEQLLRNVVTPFSCRR
jgi:hypothetical protein